MLERSLELFVVAQHHVKYLFVFTLAMDKSLEALSGNFYFLPGVFATFFSDFLVALRIIKKQFLLLKPERSIWDLDAFGPGKNTSIRICVFQISQINILGEHAIIGNTIPGDLTKILLLYASCFSIEILKTEIIIIIGSSPDQRFLDNDPKLAHFQDYLITDIVHYFPDCFRKHIL